MGNQPYLIFSLHNSRYGIVAAAVQELFFLPEVIPMIDAPAAIVGVINLRNEILPVMDLQQRLGRRSQPYQLTDSVIVLATSTDRIGVIVNQVHEVQLIQSGQIDPVPVAWEQRGQAIDTSSPLIGMAKVGETIVTLLSPDQLVQTAHHLTAYAINGSRNALLSEEADASQLQMLPADRCREFDPFANLPPEARHTLRTRADSLRHPLETEELTGLMPIAVVGINGEYFGLGLEIVHEFTDIRRVTPIPCCPPHVVGNMNLRGEIVTLIDIRPLINLPALVQNRQRQAIIVRHEQLVAGLTVDEILDVTYVHPAQITSAPVAIHSMNDEYLQGVTAYRNTMMTIVNLPKLLNSDALVINEEV